MRILTVTTSYPRTRDDYAGHFVRAGLLALRDRGHDVSVVHPHPGGDVDFENDEGIRRHAVGGTKRQSRLAYRGGMPEQLGRSALAVLESPILVAAMLRRARKLARSHDVVLSHWLVPGGWIGSRLGLPHVCVLHSGAVHVLGGFPLGGPLARSIARNTRAFVAVSHDLRSLFLELLGDGVQARVSVHPNPLAPEAFVDRAAGRSGYALFVGRLVPVKGVDVLLDALRADDAFELVVAGEGSEADALQARARERDLRVHFIGHVEGAAKRALIAGAEVVVVPSIILPAGRTEGAPTVIDEAHAAGIPVIASAVGGIPDQIVDGESGWLVRCGDAGVLREALLNAMAEGTLSLETACRRAAERNRPKGFGTLVEACFEDPGTPAP